ncbi:MAG: transglycosylase SLT domain-containing protein [Bryobacteraceae bacterium]
MAATAFAQTPESLGRAYRDSPNPARRNALEHFATGHKDANGALAHLNLGIASFEQRQFADSIQHLKSAQAKLPKLADYTAYYLAAARLENGDNLAASQDAAAVRTGSISSPFAARAVVLQARAESASGGAQDAIRLLTERYTELPQPDGDLTLAMAYEAASNLPKAVDYYQRVYSMYPTSDAATRSSSALVALRDKMGASFPAPSPRLLVERAAKLLAQRDYTRARSEFQGLLPQLSGPERDVARVGIGAADYLNGDVSAAYSYLRTLDVSDGEADAQRLYYVVECARKLNDDDQMMEAIKKLGSHYAASPWRYKALLSAANRFLVTNQRDKYTPLYKAAYESFADEPGAATCHWRVTWDAYVRRKHGTAELLREQLERYPNHPSSSAALYYLGRLAESSGDYAAARTDYTRLVALYPNYYYGLLARDRLKQPKLASAGVSDKAAGFLQKIVFPPRKPQPGNAPDPETTLRIARARLLKSAGLLDLAQSELRFGIRSGGHPYALATEFARTADKPHERLHFMKSVSGDYLSLSLEDAPPDFWRLLFPLPYEKDVVRNSRLQKLDPYIVAALIRQESEFNPQALSHKHAYGLTQVEPATGRSLARRTGVRRFSNRSLFQPALNLKLGTTYLRLLLDEWGGKWEEALASYNAGKSRVNDWITWNNYEEPSEFVESIPFTETREYVQAVLRNASMYRQLYGSEKIAAEPASVKKSTPRRRARRQAPAA